MGVFRLSAGAVALGAAAVVVATTMSLPASSTPQTPPGIGGGTVTAPCVPNSGGARGVLPQPPTIDTWALNGRTFTLRVLQFQQAGAKALYCYQMAGGPTQYVEAPTIRVKAGDQFTMRLEDRIPGAPATAAPSPAPSDDDCAQLPYEEPMPAQTAAGYTGRPRIAASMPPSSMHDDDTNFHTHGWHVDPHVDNVFKSLAFSQGRACVYTFTVPRNQPPGTYWYHAHLHGLAQNQVGGGLGGTLVVLPPDDEKITDYPSTVLLVKTYNPPATATSAPNAMAGMAGMGQPVPASAERERAHYDALFAIPHGAAPSARPAVADPFNPPAEPSSLAFPVAPATPLPYCLQPAPNEDPLTLNGLPVPNAQTGTAIPRVTQLAGTQMRYRVVNASADSFVNLAMIDSTGKQIALRVLARDGVPVAWNPDDPSHPNLRAYVTRQHVMLPPSGRADLLVDATPYDQTIVGLQGTNATAPPGGTPFCTGYFGFAMPPRGLVTIHAVRALGAAAHAAGAPAKLLSTTPGDAFAQRAIVGRRALTFTQYGDRPLGGSWYVTETSNARWQEQPFWLKPPAGGTATYLPTIRVKQGSIEEWTLINASPEIHAFHIHQLTFVALQSAFEPTQARVFLDSIALPAAQIAHGQPRTAYPLLVPSKTVVKIDFRHVDKGLFVYHCHMLYHEDHGMMGIIEVD